MAAPLGHLHVATGFRVDVGVAGFTAVGAQDSTRDRHEERAALGSRLNAIR
jgi:hypothetical protein